MNGEVVNIEFLKAVMKSLTTDVNRMSPFKPVATLRDRKSKFLLKYSDLM
jgi:hypothetical protein